MTFTPEQRAKGRATRLANRAARDAKKSSKIGRVVNVQAQKPVVVDINLQDIFSPPIEQLEKNIFTNGFAAPPFDWETCPLTEAINKAAELKREYDRVAAIVLRRQNPRGQRWTCFTEELRLAHSPITISKSVLAQCARTGEDGKWKFRDDGRFVIVNGVRTLKPAFCCNAYCYSLYQQNRQQVRV